MKKTMQEESILLVSSIRMNNLMVLKHSFIIITFIIIIIIQHIVLALDQSLIGSHRTAIRMEKAALLAFKDGLMSPSELALANWNESTDVCDFIGVGCDRWRIHVVRVKLNRTLIRGSLSPLLANLTGLRELDLSENSLTGKIPPEFSSLGRLTVLELSGNHLEGPIPESFASLRNLEYLNLGSNSLEGHIPASIFLNCTQLGIVDLSDNALSGKIPSGMGIHLQYLLTLNLYLNNLRGKIPWWISNSSYLLQLDVENNSLSGELPSEIVQNLKFLQVLHLSYNGFSSYNKNRNLDPFFVALSNCPELKELEMAGIGLGGNLPHTIGGIGKQLSVINLNDNKIFGSIPSNIRNLSNVTLLNLSDNLLNGTIPDEISQLVMLEQLILSRNFLSGTIPLTIGSIRSMGLLDLSNNRLSGDIPDCISNLTRISELYLQKNKLSGSIPASLGSCMNLNKLDLSYNRLNGEIPREVSGIAKIFLNLSNNQLQGHLPIDLSKMDQVQEIDLSSNNLSGVIIPQFSAWVEVKLINLSHNSLGGQLSKTFGDLRNLETLDVSFNYLSGEIPLTLNKCTSLTRLNLSYNNFNGSIPTDGIFASFTNLSYLGNPHLCRACRSQVKRGWLHSRKLLIAIWVGGSISAFLLVMLCVIGARKIRWKIFARKGEAFGESPPFLKSNYQRITHRELSEATMEFNPERFIGSGSYGRVYRGVLREGTVVAVKVLNLQTGNSTKSFNRECQVLKRIRHRNLMRIITACSLPDFKALVLPFMANGSLESWLYFGSHDLSLAQRVGILSDVAQGMAYLHHHSPVKVIHCDLKPSNVLLNDEMTALVSDFGIARLVTTIGVGSSAGVENIGNSTANMLCGTIGYIAPEYGYGSNVSTKGDVYSFGILVLEVLTKKRPTNEMFEGDLSLQRWVKSQYHGRVEKVVDSGLATAVRNQAVPEVRRMWDVAIGELLELGLLCSQESPSSRPTMLHAADDLDRLKRYLSGDTTATFASSLGMSSSTIGEDPDVLISHLD